MFAGQMHFTNRHLFIVILVALASGCHGFSGGRWVGPENYADGVPNPITVPYVPRELVMDEVSDEVDNYFRILREQRLRLVDNILMEGWIETDPRIGSTVLEPWRQDSTRGFELAHSSLQTVRRWCKVRVIPTGDRYLIDVKVYKEQEDLLQPSKSGIQGPIFRHDNSLDVDRKDYVSDVPNKGWIPMGRDFSLEQKILTNIQERIYQSSQDGHRR